ncbi:NAD-dependent epimerase/dehydratase family protein [Paenibacillus donghaensis]|uniref:NAD-dependent epimerase/dehydratase family protein n=1 Tax=Paenibacillus donghaensis TaxID=414771 RepID=UPI001884203F|nr:NAD-dependent epimerase/dehydratase family protein [Paenibacillus donghaensis]MBE9916020.1 NAD-dependent epimerase/dehydratase family protein [Paenibacillus donghaensis]
MKTVVLTGGAGFIGSHLVQQLIEEEMHVHVIDNLSTGSADKILSEAVLHVEDIRSQKALQTILSLKPEAVFHLAAQADVQQSILYPMLDMEINVLGTLNMLEACRKAGVRKFIFASTSGVYGNAKKDLLEETDPAEPISFYGLSKFAAEQYIRLYGELFDLDWTILRFANVYGPGQTSKGEGGVVSVFVEQLRRDAPLTVNGDGKQTRDFIYVKDVVSAIAAARKKGSREILHVSTGTATSVTRLVALLGQYHARDIQILNRPDRAGDIRNSCLSNNRIKRILDWEPKFSIEEGLRETYFGFKPLS